LKINLRYRLFLSRNLKKYNKRNYNNIFILQHNCIQHLQQKLIQLLNKTIQKVLEIFQIYLISVKLIKKIYYNQKYFNTLIPPVFEVILWIQKINYKKLNKLAENKLVFKNFIEITIRHVKINHQMILLRIYIIKMN